MRAKIIADIAITLSVLSITYWWSTNIPFLDFKTWVWQQWIAALLSLVGMSAWFTLLIRNLILWIHKGK